MCIRDRQQARATTAKHAVQTLLKFRDLADGWAQTGEQARGVAQCVVRRWHAARTLERCQARVCRAAMQTSTT
eukprot:11051709-Alexandrium_andersonii.AAC.1